MLFIQSNSLALSPTEGERLRLLDALAARGFVPLVRSLRRHMFQSLVASDGDAAFVATAAKELEREAAARHESDGEGAYTPGELFCAGDCVLSLLFREEAEEEEGGVIAGVVYSVDTSEPLTRLGRFCREVREALAEIVDERSQRAGSRRDEERGAEPATGATDWQARGARSAHGLARFIATQPADLVRAAALRGRHGLTRASELMEGREVRLFLRRVEEMRHEGYTPRRLLREADALGGVSVETMLEAGLLEREVRVSCRQSGHALFDLPSPDSLAAITISKAKCSLCAAPVADEVVEETFAPTRLAAALLEDGRWLSNRVHKLVRSLGVPDSEIATGPASAHGESHLAVEVCGSSFLFVTRDGDLTPALARRVVEVAEETEATHLVVVTTGAVEDEGHLRLHEFAWRRGRAGRDLDLTLVKGLGDARALIEQAFERAVRRELSRHLYTLDAPLGFSAGCFVLQWFKSMKAEAARRKPELPAPLLVGFDRQAAS